MARIGGLEGIGPCFDRENKIDDIFKPEIADAGSELTP